MFGLVHVTLLGKFINENEVSKKKKKSIYKLFNYR